MKTSLICIISCLTFCIGADAQDSCYCNLPRKEKPPAGWQFIATGGHGCYNMDDSTVAVYSGRVLVTYGDNGSMNSLEGQLALKTKNKATDRPSVILEFNSFKVLAYGSVFFNANATDTDHIIPEDSINHSARITVIYGDVRIADKTGIRALNAGVSYLCGDNGCTVQPLSANDTSFISGIYRYERLTVSQLAVHIHNLLGINLSYDNKLADRIVANVEIDSDARIESLSACLKSAGLQAKAIAESYSDFYLSDATGYDFVGSK